MTVPDFTPHTAREALLEIRRLLRMEGVPGSRMDVIAEAGLTRREPVNFELSDQLADRLAEAHKLLRKVLETEMASMGGEIDKALALPPDLEAMVDRRIGPAL